MKKTLTIVLAFVLVIAMSVAGTFAYLTSQDSVTNTFTVGKVAITLDETDVDSYGVKDGDTPVKKNAYTIVPGHSYIKDPVVHFQTESEASYLFIKVVNPISDIESKDAAYKSIATQITDNGWTLLSGETGVYYQKVAANNGTTVVDYKVFEGFTIDGTATLAATYADVTVTAYAIQADGFADAAAAWDAGNFT